MTKVIITLAVLISSAIFGQNPFEEGMGKALSLWSQGKNTEASSLFERIAAAEKDQWLPNYYVAMVNTTTAFGTTEKNQVDALLNKAQAALEVELNKQPNH
ncbi:MAG: hypothetical protein ACK4UK_03625, partial [Flavobacterium sp.]